MLYYPTFDNQMVCVNTKTGSYTTTKIDQTIVLIHMGYYLSIDNVLYDNRGKKLCCFDNRVVTRLIVFYGDDGDIALDNSDTKVQGNYIMLIFNDSTVDFIHHIRDQERIIHHFKIHENIRNIAQDLWSTYYVISENNRVLNYQICRKKSNVQDFDYYFRRGDEVSFKSGSSPAKTIKTIHTFRGANILDFEGKLFLSSPRFNYGSRMTQEFIQYDLEFPSEILDITQLTHYLICLLDDGTIWSIDKNSPEKFKVSPSQILPSITAKDLFHEHYKGHLLIHDIDNNIIVIDNDTHEAKNFDLPPCKILPTGTINNVVKRYTNTKRSD